MKKKRYEGGGDVDALEAANASEESQDIAKSMGAGPKNEAAPKAAPAKQRVVSKAELEKSGLSLRDYMNKQQGLTRRGESAPKEEAPQFKPRRNNSILEKSSKEMDDMLKLGLQRQEAERAMKEFKAKKTAGYAKGGAIKASSMGSVKTAKPSFGSASSRADGIASKGKTKGRYI
jgi:hypothetical protein